jgi:hypothetical protein
MNTVHYSPIGPIEGEKRRIILEWMTFSIMAPLYHWGIKSSDVEHVQGHSFRDAAIKLHVEYEVLKPIVRAILERETPEEWGEDYTKYGKDKTG